MSDDDRRRVPEAEVDPRFVERWSPRAFLREPVPPERLRSLFEAARWAPSCYNEQPWHFLFATSDADRERFASILVEANRTWAAQAPVLAFVLARRKFRRNDKPNRWASFDCGAAWMSLTLQAQALGLSTHGMAGFDEDAVYEKLSVPRDDWEAMAAIAIGKRAPADSLPDELRDKEQQRSGRDPLDSIATEGGFAP